MPGVVSTVGKNDSERKVLADVEEFGWHCVHIHTEHGLPEFTFTVGLYRSFTHPELIIFGLPSTTAHRILSIAADAVRSGAPLDLSKPTDALLNSYTCCFAEVPKDQYYEHVGCARWYYEGDDFPLYQVVWPSKSGLFPWHPDATESFRAAQPVLAASANGT